MEQSQAEQKLGQYLDRILQNENHSVVKHLMDVESQYATQRKNVSRDEELKQLAVSSILKIDKTALEQMVADPTIMFAYWKKAISDKQETRENWTIQKEFSSLSLLLAYATAELEGQGREKFLQDYLGARVAGDPCNPHLYEAYHDITLKLTDPDGWQEYVFKSSLAFVNHYAAWQKAWERAQKFKDMSMEFSKVLNNFGNSDKKGRKDPFDFKPRGRYSDAANIGKFYHITQNVLISFFRRVYESEDEDGKIVSKEYPDIPLDCGQYLNRDIVFATLQGRKTYYNLAFIGDRKIELQKH